ncbi:MAG: hypothetical protein HZB39_10530 [Planctomycetes bacterium]|nr:hypothetical protein [Planctomycetota bacterium]
MVALPIRPFVLAAIAAGALGAAAAIAGRGTDAPLAAPVTARAAAVNTAASDAAASDAAASDAAAWQSKAMPSRDVLAITARLERAVPVAVARAAGCDREPTTEREWFEKLVNEPGLATHAREILAGDQPDAHKVAVLRALCANRSPHADTLLAFAIERAPRETSPHGEDLARVATQLLCERSPRVASARTALQAIAFSPCVVAHALRRRAVAALAAHGDVDELGALATALLARGDKDLVAAALEAAAGRDEPALHERFARLLGA